MFRNVLSAVLLLLVFAAAPAEHHSLHPCESSPACLQMPALGNADFETIAARIFANETGGQFRYLTYWGEGEDFPSFGIGHFIWFPGGVDAPFDESFPAMLEFVASHRENDSELPAWIENLSPLDAPWSDKQSFEARLTDRELVEFRDWLFATAPIQARFIAHSFVERWNALDLGDTDKTGLTIVLNELLRTSDGVFAVLDYYNFKGLGENTRERYEGSGWGLVQVLSDVLQSGCIDSQVVSRLECFSAAAAQRLRQRVILAPPSRQEERWLQGWLLRVHAYVPGRNGFVVTPYLQNPQTNSMTVIWFSHKDSPGTLEVWPQSDESHGAKRRIESSPLSATSLSYHAVELKSLQHQNAATPIFRHELVVDRLAPGNSYQYVVRQGDDTAGGTIQTSPNTPKPLRFVVYGDSETEPESSGKRTAWPRSGENNTERRYLVDQTTGYAANLNVIRNRRPAFIAIAGDLVESGGEQRDWDEFWRHNAKLAASIPILPALGNHEYYGGPGEFGAYGAVAAWRAIAKYKTYFTVPEPGTGTGAYKGHYYSLRYGPVSLIVIDSNDGIPHQSAADSNWRLSGGGIAPAWNDESEQLAWLEKELQRAQRSSAFTFVMFHAAPYSSGVHNQPPGLDDGEDYLSGVPLRELTPLFMRYGVDAVFNGHDEVYEHSVLHGIERTDGGLDRNHSLHFLVVGIGGDGLRGSFAEVQNAHRVFSAQANALEVYDNAGVLVSGGKHYGHLEVNVAMGEDGCWSTRIEPVYVFPVMAKPDSTIRFERRIYDDVTRLTSCRVSGDLDYASRSEK